MPEGICKEYTHPRRRTIMHCIQRLTEREIQKTRLMWERDRTKMSLVKAINEEYQKKRDRKDKDKRDQK